MLQQLQWLLCVVCCVLCVVCGVCCVLCGVWCEYFKDFPPVNFEAVEVKRNIRSNMPPSWLTSTMREVPAKRWISVGTPVTRTRTRTRTLRSNTADHHVPFRFVGNAASASLK